MNELLSIYSPTTIPETELPEDRVVQLEKGIFNLTCIYILLLILFYFFNYFYCYYYFIIININLFFNYFYNNLFYNVFIS